jgi:meso-butanediol dehydrogenase/(S,S)-butanediol dehydrogenase/diacetyl reductase
MRFSDRVVVVTGSGSGIGEVMAESFASEGASVVVCDRNGDKAESVAKRIRASARNAIATETDVSVGAQVDTMASRAEEAYGAVDVLVNNAAIGGDDGLLVTGEEAWDAELAVVLKSAFLCSKRVLPGMIERRRGVIVNIASVNGISYFGNESYSAAKAGMINLTQSIAVRYGPYGIRANAIAPGSIRTPIWQERVEREPEIFERITRWYPLGRVGEPRDVANAALFLASDDAAWITGTVLRVDGGLLAGNGPMTREIQVETREPFPPGPGAQSPDPRGPGASGPSARIASG